MLRALPFARLLFLLLIVVFTGSVVLAENSGVIVFSEAGFPSADSGMPTPQQLAALFPTATLIGADQLSHALSADGSRLLVLPYGSAFPEESWPAIKNFLDRGGNLLVLGGRPFTRAAY